MSSWKCGNCSLSNSKSVNKCIACFNYNTNKFWQCHECDLLNRMHASKCSACYTIKKPLFKIDNKWNITYLNIPDTVSSRYSSKMILWHNKLYSIIVSALEKEIKIVMVDHIENETNDLNQSVVRFPNWFPNDNYYYFRNDSWCINQEKAELYIIINACDSNFVNVLEERNKTYLFIYDLNKQTIKKQYTLNFDEKLSASNIHKVCIINNNQSEQNMSDQISFNVIHNWLRRNISMESLEFIIPNDVYILINKFYSFCFKNNSLQLIIFGHEFTKRGIVCYSWKLHHTIIDFNALNINDNDSTIDLKVINTKILKIQSRAYMTKGTFVHVICIKIGYELYMMFHDRTWKVNLQNGAINPTESLNPYKLPFTPNIWNEYLMAYDPLSCINRNEKYSYFLMEDPNKSNHPSCYYSLNFALFCFDKVNKAFFELSNSKNIDRAFQHIMKDRVFQYKDLDMVFYGDELIVSGTEGTQRFIYKTKLNMTSN